MRIVRNETKPYSLPVIGKVKTGMKDANNEYPISLDYFRFDSQVKKRESQMKSLFGDKPSELPITFHSNSIDEVCSERLELRNSSGQLVAYGDGEVFYRSVEKGFEKEDSRIYGTEKYMSGLSAKSSTSKYKAEWHEVLILRFIILGCTELGVWEYRTKAKETTIHQITSMFDMCLSNFGRVVMLPFNLTVKKHKSNRANSKNTYPVVNLICDLDIIMAEKVLNHGEAMTGLLTAEKINSFEEPKLLT
jgi:hypothetical protein